MNNIIEKENIENLIYEVRGKQVILASDVARLYESETKIITIFSYTSTFLSSIISIAHF